MIELFDTITLTGFIGVDAGTNGARITGAVSTEIDYVGSLSGYLDLRINLPGNAEGAGIIGRATLAIADGGAIPGVELSGYITLEINSYGTAKTITTFATKFENGEVPQDDPRASLLATKPTGGFVERP